MGTTAVRRAQKQSPVVYNWAAAFWEPSDEPPSGPAARCVSIAARRLPLAARATMAGAAPPGPATGPLPNYPLFRTFTLDDGGEASHLVCLEGERAAGGGARL